jgi:hypothetical protein
MRTVSDRIGACTRGRPVRRLAYVHWRTTRWRCHRRMVSGVAMVATSRRVRRPSRCPIAARRRRSSSLSRRRRPRNLRLQRPVLFAQERDQVVLLLMHPTAEHRDEPRERRHGANLTSATLDPVSGQYGQRSARLPSCPPGSFSPFRLRNRQLREENTTWVSNWHRVRGTVEEQT